MIISYIASSIRHLINWFNSPSRDYEGEIADLTVQIDKAKRQKKKHSHLVEQREAIRTEQLAEELDRKLASVDFARL